MSTPSSDPLALGLQAQLRKRRAQARTTLGAPELRPLQRQIFADERVNPGARNYTVATAWQIEGTLDQDALARAIERVSRDCDALRLRVVDDGADPVPTFSDLHPFGLEIQEVGEEALACADKLMLTPIRMNAPSLSRFTLLVGADAWVLVILLHHAITDHRSNVLLMRHLSEAYAAALRGDVSDKAVGKGYLMALKLKPAPAAEVADLPTLNWPTAVGKSDLDAVSRRQTLELPAALVARLRESAQLNNVSLYGVISATYQIVLAAYCDQSDITIGVSRSTRTNSADDETFGFHIENTAISSDISPQSNLLDLARSITRAVTRPLGHPGVRPNTVINATCILYRDGPEPLLLEGARTQPYAPAFPPASVALHLGLMPVDGGLSACFEGRCSIFSLGDLQRLSNCMSYVLQQFADEATICVADLRFLRDEEITADHRAHFVEAAVCTGTLIDKFRETALLHPDAPALRAGTLRFSYDALDAHTDQLALGLFDQGVRAEDAVGLLMPRGSDLIFGTLAVLKLGGVVVPIDTAQPNERVDLALSQADCRFVIGGTQSPRAGAKPLILKAGDGELPDTPPRTEDDTAYVLFTSGSTGTPKGSLTPHRAFLRLSKYLATPQLAPGDRVSQMASPSFDGALIEIWPALLNGAELIVPTSPLERLADYTEFFEENAVTHGFLSTSLFNALVDFDRAGFASMKWLSVGGEAISSVHAARFQVENPDCMLVNGYGPTENGGFTTLQIVDACEDPLIPIGTALANTQNVVVSATGAPVPTGFAGELWIGGEGLSKGYVQAPELTAAAFVHCNPARFGARDEGDLLLYRTGDRVKRREDGALIYLGRQKSFVKFNGHRIEPDELAAALSQVEGVAAAAILPVLHADGIKVQRLVGFYVPEGAGVSPEYARARLRAFLPPYMMPSQLTAIEALPRNINGKIDRPALRTWYYKDRARSVRSKQDVGIDTNGVAALWRRVLDTSAADLSDDFFQCGGDSLKAMTFLADIEQRTGRSLDAAEFFDAPTLGAVIALLQDKEIAQTSDLKHVFQMRAGTEDDLPLFVVFGHLGVPSWANYIVRHLPPGRRVYGLRLGRTEVWAERGSGLDDMARVIAEEILKVANGASLHLIGYSFGGALAVEIAAHLRAQKQPLGRVILVDAGLNFAAPGNALEVSDPMGPEKYLVPLWLGYRLRAVPVHLDIVQGFQSMPLPADDLSALWAMVATGGCTRHQTSLRHEHFYGRAHGAFLADMLASILSRESTHPSTPPNLSADDMLANAYAGREAMASGDYASALKIYTAMGKGTWRIKMMAAAAVEASDRLALLRLALGVLLPKGVDPSVYANLSQTTRRMKWSRMSLALARRSLTPGEPGNTALVLALARCGRTDDALEAAKAMRAAPQFATDGLVLEAMVRLGMGAARDAVETAMAALRRSDLAVVHVVFLCKAFAAKPDIAKRLLDIGAKRFPEDGEIRTLVSRFAGGDTEFG
jgi:amino acid adenylation domain-containing protein